MRCGSSCAMLAAIPAFQWGKGGAFPKGGNDAEDCCSAHGYLRAAARRHARLPGRRDRGVGHARPAGRGEELFADRPGRLPLQRAELPGGFHQGLPPLALLVRALLTRRPPDHPTRSAKAPRSIQHAGRPPGRPFSGRRTREHLGNREQSVYSGLTQPFPYQGPLGACDGKGRDRPSTAIYEPRGAMK